MRGYKLWGSPFTLMVWVEEWLPEPIYVIDFGKLRIGADLQAGTSADCGTLSAARSLRHQQLERWPEWTGNFIARRQ